MNMLRSEIYSHGEIQQLFVYLYVGYTLPWINIDTQNSCGFEDVRNPKTMSSTRKLRVYI